MWYVTISDTTRAYDQAQLNQECPDQQRDIDEGDIDTVESRTYKTVGGVSNYIDRFAMSLWNYMVLEHVRTDDEHYLRCVGRRDGEYNGTRTYEVHAYRQ